jgi:hypothetical protein
MTTITIDEDIKNRPDHFRNLEELPEFALNEIRVAITPLAEEELNNDLIERINKSRQKFKNSPESFDDIR